MGKSVVYQKMRELEIKIHYHFNDIAWLSKAMRSEKIEVSGEGKNHSEYTNDGLATIGDTVLKSVIADYLYRKGITTKGEITQIKSKLENNEVMHNIMLKCGLIGYAYNAKTLSIGFGCSRSRKSCEQRTRSLYRSDCRRGVLRFKLRHDKALDIKMAFTASDK